MKFALSMLKDFVSTEKSAEEIGDLLTMAGFELEGIESVEDEKVLDIKVVSNRGDGLSVLGLAREVLAKDAEARPTDLYLQAAKKFASQPATTPSGVSVEIDTEDCTRYACWVFEGDFNVLSPEWIQKRLRVAGMRPFGPLVDLTNYIMLELGQPLHAYDLDKLSGHRIVVRKAQSGEKLTTLNGEAHTLTPEQMMICDAERPVGAAGIMGGLDTEVTPRTRRILLESAHFVNTSVRRTRRELGISTEASYRFERSVDPEGVVSALTRFKTLLRDSEIRNSNPEILDRGLIDVYPSPPNQVRVSVRISRANELLGVQISAADARGYLERLGFEVGAEGSTFEVAVPSWRPDVTQEYDVIEEIGRIHGFDHIPEQPICGTTTLGGVFGFDSFLEEVRGIAVRLGYVQNVSSSLMDEHPLDDPRGERMGPRHPSSPEMSLLRNSLWPNLADNGRRNGGVNLRLFEIGAVFGSPEPDDEIVKVGMLATSGPAIEHWEKPPHSVPSFFSLKGEVEEILGLSSICPAWRSSKDPRLHPTRQAFLPQGVLVGQIHPDTAQRLGMSEETFLAEIDLESLFAHRSEMRKLRPISRNPAVRRDIAILIDKAAPYETIQQAISEASGELLEKQWLFDVYEGTGIPEGKHSLGIALQFRKMGENLTDEEANQVRDRSVEALVKLGAIQR